MTHPFIEALPSLREAMLEAEVATLRRRCEELEWRLGTFAHERIYDSFGVTASPPDVVPLDPRVTSVRAIASLESRITRDYGLEVVGETNCGVHSWTGRSRASVETPSGSSRQERL